MSFSLNDVADIAMTTQGVLFIFSIVLVWYQLRENTNLVRAANTQKLVELSTPYYLQMAQSRDLTGLWQRGTQNFAELDEIDRERYFNLVIWWLMLHENIYHQWKQKLIDDETYKSWTFDLEHFVQRVHLSNHWDRLNTFFEISFSAHVTTIVEQKRAQQKPVAARVPHDESRVTTGS